MMRWAAVSLVMTGLLLGAAPPAAAQISLGPIVGAITGHVGSASGTDGLGTTLSAGVSMGVVESTGWGAEFDAAFAAGDGKDGGLEAQTYMLNVLGMWPKGKLRPFGVLGAGALRATTCVDGCTGAATWTDWGMSAGGGAFYFLNETVGLRGDVRFLSTIGNHPDPARSVQFWRVAFGATFVWTAD